MSTIFLSIKRFTFDYWFLRIYPMNPIAFIE